MPPYVLSVYVIMMVHALVKIMHRNALLDTFRQLCAKIVGRGTCGMVITV